MRTDSVRKETGDTWSRPPRGCVVHTGGGSLDALAFHLGFMGFEFDVHEPEELIEQLRRLAERLGRAAGRSGTAGEGSGAR